MRSVETINMEAILSGGEARTTDLNYARALASRASEIKDRSCEIDYNDDGSYSVRLVPQALLDAAMALRAGMVEERPAPGVTVFSDPACGPGRHGVLEVIDEASAVILPKPADHVVRDRQAVAEGLTPPYFTLGPRVTGVTPDRRSGEDRRLPSRSEGFVLVGTYELVIGGDDNAATDRYRRLNLTSVATEIRDDSILSDQLTDALNTVAFMEHDLDPAAVFSIVGADAFEEENEEKII